MNVVGNAALWDFALLTSAMHMAWLRIIGGRLESRYRHSIGLVYNTFPIPVGADLSKLTPFAEAILNARAAYPGETFEVLYDPDLMPEDLREAHRKTDEGVDKLYRRRKFKGDQDRVEHLLTLYEALT